MAEAQTIRMDITESGKPFSSCDLPVYPWHIGQFNNWAEWLHHVAPEWVERTAGNPAGEYQAVARDVSNRLVELADITFTHPA